VNDWKEFRFGDLLSKIYKATAYVKNDIEYFDSPSEERIRFITRTENKNGCDCYIDKTSVTSKEKGGALIIGDTTSTIFYQEEDFVTGDHIVVCRADWINKYTALFVKSLIEKERYKYSYGRSFKMDLINETILKMPATKDGSPDWSYMENYIKALPYGDRI